MSNAVNAPDANRGNNAEYRAVTSNPSDPAVDDTAGPRSA